MSNILPFPAHRARTPLLPRGTVTGTALAEIERALVNFARLDPETLSPANSRGGWASPLTPPQGEAQRPHRFWRRCCGTAVAVREDTIAVGAPGEPARAALDFHATPDLCIRVTAEVIDLDEARRRRA